VNQNALLNLGQIVVRMIYERQMYAILENTAPTLLVAGRGMGKTSVLQGVAEQNQGLYVAGREVDKALSDFDAALKKMKKEDLPLVLVDDLDYLLDEERNSRSVEALRMIEALLSEMKRTHGQLIVASTSPASRFLRTFACQFWSNIEDRFQRVVLFPWSMGWRETLLSAMLWKFPERGEEYAPAVEVTTGGHPALASAAFVSLQETEAAGRVQADIDWSAYLSSILGRASLSPIEKALTRLQRSTHPTDQEALDYLKALVIRPDDQEKLPSPQAIRTLEISGLAYSDPLTGRGIVPGTIIQRYLEGELVAQPEIPVTVISRGNDEGVLVVGDSPVFEIPLSKGPWRLVESLFNARGETVAIDELQKRLELDSPKPLYSIIQRLDQKAKEARLDRLIENVRGQGYRLNRALRWKA
jgi:ATPase family associated with various cellular activities (AAA)